MSSMFAKAAVVTGIIFVPMIVINTILVNSPEFKLLDWKTLTTAGISLLMILVSAIAIKTRGK